MPSADRERAVVQGTVEERIVQAAQVCRCHCSQYHYGDIFPSFSVAMSWLLVFRPAIAGSNAKMSGSICGDAENLWRLAQNKMYMNAIVMRDDVAGARDDEESSTGRQPISEVS